MSPPLYAVCYNKSRYLQRFNKLKTKDERILEYIEYSFFGAQVMLDEIRKYGEQYTMVQYHFK